MWFTCMYKGMMVCATSVVGGASDNGLGVRNSNERESAIFEAQLTISYIKCARHQSLMLSTVNNKRR